MFAGVLEAPMALLTVSYSVTLVYVTQEKIFKFQKTEQRYFSHIIIKIVF